MQAQMTGAQAGQVWCNHKTLSGLRVRVQNAHYNNYFCYTGTTCLLSRVLPRYLNVRNST
jgi:hypothetical protein